MLTNIQAAPPTDHPIGKITLQQQMEYIALLTDSTVPFEIAIANASGYLKKIGL
jgi:hypothetical protein